MVTEQAIQSNKDLPMAVWTTKNVKIVRVIPLWADVLEYYHFIPCSKRGFVIVTNQGEVCGCMPAQGYTLLRPTALSLHWHTDRAVTFRVITKIAALDWRARTHKRWKTISKRSRKSQTLPWWA